MNSKKGNIGILGLGAYLPDKVLTNLDLEKMVDTSDEWIKTRTGIQERHIISDDMSTSDLAKFAADKAIEKAKINKEDIGLIIVATITPDMLMPSTACVVQAKLGIKDVMCFDINAACSGFIYGVEMARSFLMNNGSKYALVIGAEVLSRFVDWQDRSTCVLFGDGAGACILGQVDGEGILAADLGADGTQADLLKIPAGGSKIPITKEVLDEKLGFLKMAGNEVFKIAVRTMTDSASRVISKAGLKCEDIDCIIPHQANIRIIDATVKRLDIPKERVFLNIDKCGNMSAASIAVALYDAVKANKVKSGDTVVLVAFGGGLTWGSIVLKWQ